MSRFLKKIIFFGLVLAIASPVFFSQKPLFGILLRQEVFFQGVIEFVFILYLFLAFLEPSYRPRPSMVAIAVLVWLFVWGAVTFLSPDISRSFLSSRDRLTGYFLSLHLGAFFFVLTSFLQNEKDQRKFLLTSIVTSVLVSLYGLGQRFGFVGAPIRVLGSFRISSLFGNPSFLAGYLLFNIFFALWLFSKETRKNWRYFLAGSLALNGLVLFLTSTRGALLGLYASAIAFLVLLLLRLEQARLKKFAVLGLTGLILLPLFIFLLGRVMPSFKEASSPVYLTRLTNISDLWVSGLRNRVLVWEIAWEAAKEKPLLGWGPERFNVAFDKYFNPELVAATGAPESWFDRSHNIFFDALVQGGAIGVLGTLVLLGSLFASSIQLLRKELLGGVIFFAAILGYIVQGLFVFDTFGTLLPLFLTAGVLASLSPLPRVQPLAEKQKTSFLPFLFGIPVALAVLFVFVKFNVLPARAQGLARQAFEEIHQDPDRFKALWSKSLAYDTRYHQDIWLEFTEYLFGSSPDYSRVQIPRNVLVTYLKIAKDEFALFDESQLDSRMYYQAGKVGNFLGVLGENDPEFVEKNLLKALSLSPQRLDVYYELAELERLRGNHAKQFEWLNKAISLREDVSFSWWNLGIAYADVGDYKRAVGAMEKAITMGYIRWQNPELIPFIVRIYDLGNGPILRIVEFWETATQLSPQNAQFYASLAAAYARAGETEKARRAVARAVELDPSLEKEAEAFLRSL